MTPPPWSGCTQFGAWWLMPVSAACLFGQSLLRQVCTHAPLGATSLVMLCSPRQPWDKRESGRESEVGETRGRKVVTRSTTPSPTKSVLRELPRQPPPHSVRLLTSSRPHPPKRSTKESSPTEQHLRPRIVSALWAIRVPLPPGLLPPRLMQPLSPHIQSPLLQLPTPPRSGFHAAAAAARAMPAAVTAQASQHHCTMASRKALPTPRRHCRRGQPCHHRRHH